MATNPTSSLNESSDLRARALYSPRPMLVMVRNRAERKLLQPVPEMEPLWNDWEYSIWKIPAGIEKGIGDGVQGTVKDSREWFLSAVNGNLYPLPSHYVRHLRNI